LRGRLVTFFPVFGRGAHLLGGVCEGNLPWRRISGKDLVRFSLCRKPGVSLQWKRQPSWDRGRGERAHFPHLGAEKKGEPRRRMRSITKNGQNQARRRTTYLRNWAEKRPWIHSGFERAARRIFWGWSYSSVRYVGHTLARSWEDSGILIRRGQKDSGELFAFLDKKWGAGTYRGRR